MKPSRHWQRSIRLVGLSQQPRHAPHPLGQRRSAAVRAWHTVVGGPPVLCIELWKPAVDQRVSGMGFKKIRREPDGKSGAHTYAGLPPGAGCCVDGNDSPITAGIGYSLRACWIRNTHIAFGRLHPSARKETGTTPCALPECPAYRGPGVPLLPDYFSLDVFCLCSGRSVFFRQAILIGLCAARV